MLVTYLLVITLIQQIPPSGGYRIAGACPSKAPLGKGKLPPELVNGAI